nr:MAG: adhesin BspA variable domain protein [Bacteriophage sp.]
MADQATLNQEQITKVRQALSLNIYSTDSGTKTYISGNSFRIENPMTVPSVGGDQIAVGHVNTEGSIYYDLVVEGTKIKAKNTRAVIKSVSYTKVPGLTISDSFGNASYRINTPQGMIFNKSYDPSFGNNWTETINRQLNINNVEISSKVNEQRGDVATTIDQWIYNPTTATVSFSLTVPNTSILNIPQAPKEGTLVIKYVDNVTGATLNTYTKKVPGDISQSHTALEIYRATYKITGNRTQSVTVPSGQTKELVFRYNPVYGQIVKYIDKDTGREIKTQSYTPVTHGDPFRQDPPSIQGYRLVPGQNPINVTRVTGNGNYSFRYERIPTTANVIVKHLNKANNQPLRGDVTLSNQTIGSNVTYNAPAITNYAPERTTYTHTVVEGNNIITVYYTENAKIRPWAIRKSNAWKSLNTTRQWMKIRRTANQNFWDTKPNAEIYATDTGKENYSPSRIRKGGKWKAQGKIGD